MRHNGDMLICISCHRCSGTKLTENLVGRLKVTVICNLCCFPPLFLRWNHNLHMWSMDRPLYCYQSLDKEWLVHCSSARLSVTAMDCYIALHRQQVIAPQRLFDSRQAALTWLSACGSPVCLVDSVIWMSNRTYCFPHGPLYSEKWSSLQLSQPGLSYSPCVNTHQGRNTLLTCCLRTRQERSGSSSPRPCLVGCTDFHWHLPQHSKWRQLCGWQLLLPLVWRLACVCLQSTSQTKRRVIISAS